MPNHQAGVIISRDGHNNTNTNNKSEVSQKAQEKSHTHRLILLQTPLWVLSVLYVMQTGVLRSWTDLEYLLFSVTVASPSVLLPALLPPRRPLDNSPGSQASPSPNRKPDSKGSAQTTKNAQDGNDTNTRKAKRRRTSYWIKLNIYIFILVLFGTYFGTHYFFDLMGMRYTFGDQLKWHFESDVLGRHGCAPSLLPSPNTGTKRQVVPLFMYPLTHAYFMTYFSLLIVLEDLLLQTLSSPVSKLKGQSVWGGILKKFIKGSIVLGLSYALAFLETYIMASPLLEDLFRYKDRDRMLKVGSLGYAAYFVVGLPMVGRIDEDSDSDKNGDAEDGESKEWTLGRVVIEALATCMGIMCLLEIWGKLVGPL